MIQRLATSEDLPVLWRLLDDYKAGFTLDSDAPLTPTFARNILNGPCWTIADSDDYAVGFVWFTDIDALHAISHVLIEPQALRGVLKKKLIEAVLTEAFTRLGSNRSLPFKLMGKPDLSQSVAIKLLKRLQFKQNGLYRNHVLRNGKALDVFAFELHRKYWERHGQKQNSGNNIQPDQRQPEHKRGQLLQPLRQLSKRELLKPPVQLVQPVDSSGERQNQQLHGVIADLDERERHVQQSILCPDESVIRCPDQPPIRARPNRINRQLKRSKSTRQQLRRFEKSLPKPRP